MGIFKSSAQGPAWEPEAKEALKQVPLVVRKLAKSKIEQKVRQQGRDRVTLADYQVAESRFKSVMGGKSSQELSAAMPQKNRPGVEMVVVNACRSQLSNCPNVLVDTAPWQRAVEEAVSEGGFSERLRAKLDSAQVLFHHKLKISLSGCPNGCSRPQIADIGLVGRVRPSLEEDCCISCGLCLEACPDQAISLSGEVPQFDSEACQGCKGCSLACEQDCIQLSPPAMRVLAGGKLGRHPHLAQPVCELSSPEELKPLISQWLEEYLASSEPEQRFSVWWQGRGQA